MATLSNELYHYGVKRRSGRYPWGSGKDPYQRSCDILGRIDELRKSGMTSEKDLANAMDLENTSELRTMISWATNQRRAVLVAQAKDLRNKGYSLRAIADQMGYKNDSSVRSLLNEDSEARMLKAQHTADFLKEQIDKYGMVEVGAGTEIGLHISKEKKDQALFLLELEGYEIWGGGVKQATNPGQQTTLVVACKPGTPHSAIYDYDKIHFLGDEYTSHDDGETFTTLKKPSSFDSKRLAVKYAEDGGTDRDGVIEIRRNVPDLSLGDAHYAQVRIMVDGTHYLKGMAVYSDDLPEGCDIRFNTNKPKGTPILGPKNNTVLKNIKTDDPNNPFGALIKPSGQSEYIDPVTGEKRLSPINKTREEGDWHEWADRLSSQFLAKQNKALVKRQLDLAAADKYAEFEEIMGLTNPTVKKNMLKTFSDDCDSAAVHLYAAALPGQKYQVILPVPSIGDKKIFAPNYKDGEELALIRYPHAGTFEIPILKVDNKNAEAKGFMSGALDAVGISPHNAGILSGADFDGDTVMVIPLGHGPNRINITSTKPLKELEGFDPKMAYPYQEGMKIMKNTQNEMGRISNLITDMQLSGDATDAELARAVKHSMVVIDAEKHRLNYQKSYIDNDIATLKAKYQPKQYDPLTGKERGGAATLISRSKSEYDVPKRKGSPHINEKGKPWYDPEKPEGALIYKSMHINAKDKPWYDPNIPEGEKMYILSEEKYDVTKKRVDADGKPVIGDDGKPIFDPVYNKDGTPKTKIRTQKSTRMAEVDDAHILSSGTPKEEIYADFANKMKALANEARMEMIHTGEIKYNPDAKQKYLKEHDALMAKLNDALINAPRERQAQIIANSKTKIMFEANPYMSKKDKAKAKQMAITEARAKVGAKRVTINITPEEWNAIQSGAISPTKLKQILLHTDGELIKRYATPRTSSMITEAKANKIRSMRNAGFTNAQIAESVGLSSSAVVNYLKTEKEGA